jgi:hypothetical protein
MTTLDVLKHPGLPGIEIYLTEITPQIAKQFLNVNAEGQRNINSDVTARYAEDMASGSWLFSGAAVLFSDKGELIDGQHRLTAIVDSGLPQLTLVVAGLNQSVLHAIDAGRKKTYGQLLAMKYERPSADAQAATIRAYWYWTIGNYGGRAVPRRPVPSEHANALPTNSQLEAARIEVETRLGITFTQAAQVAQQATLRMRGVTGTVWALVWVLLTEYDIDLRERFFHELLVAPVSPAADYPINALKNRLGRVREAGELDRTMQLYFILKTFNAWRTGRLIASLTKPNSIAWNTLELPPTKAGN